MAKFFRIFLPEYEERMRIPASFAQLLIDKKGSAVRTVSISSPLGRLWHVKLGRDRRNAYFTKGWPEFLEAHEMQLEELMVFSYEGQSTFSVEIFDKTTSIKTFNCRNGQSDSRALVSPDGGPGSSSVYCYTGEDGISKFTTETIDSESWYSSSEGWDSCDIELTVPDTARAKKMDGKGKKAIIPSNLDKETENSDKDIRVHSGTTVNGTVNQRDRKSNTHNKKNVNSKALSTKGYGFKTINEAYNFNYMPLNKAFCGSSVYNLTPGKATVRNEKLVEFPVIYRVCSSYNFIGKGWRNFILANNVRSGDRCQIKITGDNEFLVIIKHM